MPGISIDFSEVEDSFEALPEGVYNTVIEDAQVRESKSSDNPYINFEMKVLDEEFEDRRIWIGASLSPKALWGLKEVLVNIGAIDPEDAVDLEWDEEVDMTPKEGPQITNPEVIGLPALVQTVNSVYENRERQDAWKSSVLAPDEEEGAPTKKAARAKAKGKGKAGGAKKRKLR